MYYEYLILVLGQVLVDRARRGGIHSLEVHFWYMPECLLFYTWYDTGKLELELAPLGNEAYAEYLTGTERSRICFSGGDLWVVP